MENTIQEKMLLGIFGEEYTERNIHAPEKLDEDYKKLFLQVALK